MPNMQRWRLVRRRIKENELTHQLGNLVIALMEISPGVSYGYALSVVGNGRHFLCLSDHRSDHHLPARCKSAGDYNVSSSLTANKKTARRRSLCCADLGLGESGNG